MTVSTESTISIDAAGNAAPLRPLGHATVSINIRGDAPADYAVDIKTNSGSWIQDVITYSGSADYDDVIEQPADDLRVRCTSGTAGSGDEATVTLIAA